MNDSFLEEKIDIDENTILRNSPELLKILLRDRTTGKNIIWATKTYELLGKEFESKEHIKVKSITGKNASLIRPRTEKLKYEKKERTKGKAEVFTPRWIVKKQNEIVDKEFENLKLKDYITKIWLEITCGEAPYMVSRYDSVTGESIPIQKRVGFIDKKFKRINREIDNESEWIEFAITIYQTSYGYEFQGDSLLIARENLLNTFIDYYDAKFNQKPSIELQKKIAKIISYNVFQMDGLKFTVPYTEESLNLIKTEQINLFQGLKKLNEDNPDMIKQGTPVKIKNWVRNRMIEFREIKEERQMKFDVVIGNPPYQEEAVGDSNKNLPVYDKFMDESFKIADKVELITPGRFLFNAGATGKVWNRKILTDEHLKVVYYNQNSNEIFSNTDIKGGIAITYRDVNKVFGAIEIFSVYSELNSVLHKVSLKMDDSFGTIMYGQNTYQYTKKLHELYPEAIGLLSKGHENDITTNAFKRISMIYHDEKPNDGKEYVKVYGRVGTNRVYKYIQKDFVTKHDNLYKYKVFLPAANGSGAFGERLSTPIIGNPNVISTQTFLPIGSFETESEVQGVLKYLKAKFTRALLGVLKVTQHNPAAKWKYVPMQDFTSKSDINWTRSISEIDKQLYEKYNLTEEEINFIETKVKEME